MNNTITAPLFVDIETSFFFFFYFYFVPHKFNLCSLVRFFVAAFSLGFAVLYKNYGDMKTLISAPKFDFNEY